MHTPACRSGGRRPATFRGRPPRLRARRVGDRARLLATHLRTRVDAGSRRVSRGLQPGLGRQPTPVAEMPNPVLRACSCRSIRPWRCSATALFLAFGMGVLYLVQAGLKSLPRAVSPDPSPSDAATISGRSVAVGLAFDPGITGCCGATRLRPLLTWDRRRRARSRLAHLWPCSSPATEQDGEAGGRRSWASPASASCSSPWSG